MFGDSDNHPGVMSVSYGEKRIWSLMFLLAWVIIGLLVMSYATAVMFDVYIHKQNIVTSQDRVRMLETTFALFATILPSYNGAPINHITLADWIKVCLLMGKSQRDGIFLFAIVHTLRETTASRELSNDLIDFEEFHELMELCKVKIEPVADTPDFLNHQVITI